MFRTNDPLEDYRRHEIKQHNILKRLPKCAECGEPIQQDDAVYIGGEHYCDDCLKDARVQIGGVW